MLQSILNKIATIDALKKRIRTKLNGLSKYGDSTPLVGSNATLEECTTAIEGIRELEELQYQRSSSVTSKGYMLNLSAPQADGSTAYTGYVKNPYAYIPASELQLIPVYGQSNPEVHLAGTEGYVTEDDLNGVSVEIPLQSKSVSPSTASQSVYPDSGYYGLSAVTVGAVTTQEKSASPSTSAQTITPDSGKFLSRVTIGAAPKQSKTVSPLTSAQTVSPDSGYYGLSSVTVNAIATQEKTVTSSTSAQTVTPDSGKYLSKVTVNAIGTATQATPSISVSSAGLITASATQSAGYVNAGTKSATKQLTTKGEATFTPSTSNQTIASGTYLTGTQTIKGDANLVAGNIKKGVSIFGVNGSYEGNGSGLTPSTASAVDIRASGTLDGVSLWGNYNIRAVGYTSDYALFKYTLTAGTETTLGNSGSGEEYSVAIRLFGSTLTQKTYSIIVKSWNGVWEAGQTTARYTDSGYFAIPISGVPGDVTALVMFKSTKTSTVASAVGTIKF